MSKAKAISKTADESPASGVTSNVRAKDLIPDDENFNKGNEFGEALIEKSFARFGAGRSILLDKNNRIIAGNKSTQKFVEGGGDNVVIVETSGDTLVAVKRTDIDLDSPRGREMALADNATAKANISWDASKLAKWEMPSGEWGVEAVEEVIDGLEDGEEIEIENSVQLEPPKEYILIMCEPNSEEWEELKGTLKLKMVKRGGYANESAFNAVGLERVLTWSDFQKRYKKNASRGSK